MSDDMPPIDEELKRMQAGHCIHGHGHVNNCGTCRMTLHLAGTLRSLVAAMLAPRRDPAATRATALDPEAEG